MSTNTNPITTKPNTTRQVVAEGTEGLQTVVEMYVKQINDLAEFCGFTEDEADRLEHSLVNLHAEMAYLRRLLEGSD